MDRRGLVALILACALPVIAACGNGSSSAAGPSITASEAEAWLARVVLAPGDAGPGYTAAVARTVTNDEAAKARPDTDSARRQYEDWGQILAYNVQFAAPQSAELVFTGKAARVMNTATLYRDADGASAALASVRQLAPDVVANFLVNDGAGTKISETQMITIHDFPAKGDESFAWRLSGKAVMADGFTVNFVADTVYVQVGRVMGNVTAVALGEPPERGRLTELVDTFVSRVRAAES
jgi:hypothetical protein